MQDSSTYEIFSIIAGSLGGAILLYVIFAFPFIVIRRRYFYEKFRIKNTLSLYSDDYFTYITNKVNFPVSKDQIHLLTKLEHAKFKTKKGIYGQQEHYGFPLSEITTILFAIRVMHRNHGSKKVMSEYLAHSIKTLNKNQILKIIRLEDRYLLRQLPLWQRFLLFGF